MKQLIGIVDYGLAGNIFNIKKALEHCDSEVKVILIRAAADIKKADKLILPGVGSYQDAMNGIAPIQETLIAKIKHVPTLGICLGMQLLAQKGYEFQETRGLSLIEGEVMKIAVQGRIPHMGWAPVESIKKTRILKGIPPAESFYFMHSYELLNYTEVVALSQYAEHRFVAAIERDNLFGVQFHPEKSRLSGLRIFKNFISL